MTNLNLSSNINKPKNPVALITGGANRIGKILAINLAKKGYDLAISYNNSQKQALILQQELINKFKIEVEIFQCNLNCEVETTNLAQKICNIFGKNLQLLINNASIFEKSQFTDKNFLENFLLNFNIHLKAPLILSHHFVKNAINHKIDQANIINLIDCDIFRTKTINFYYLLSKKSLAELTKMVAATASPYNIRVNGICPGFIFDLENNSIEEENSRFNSSAMLIKYRNNPQNIVETLNFIINNSAITGQLINVDCGSSIF